MVILLKAKFFQKSAQLKKFKKLLMKTIAKK